MAPQTAAHQASLAFTSSRSLLKLTSIESVWGTEEAPRDQSPTDSERSDIVKESLTPFFDVWLLTNFKSHYYLCPFCPTTRQVKKGWMGQESLFRHEWEVQTMEAPAHGNGNPCPSLTSSPPKSPKSSFFSPLQSFLDQHAWSTLEPTLLFPERLMMWVINLY